MLVANGRFLPFATLALIQWIGFNVSKDIAGWLVISNQGVDLVVLFLAYALYRMNRELIGKFIVGVMVARIFWHAVAAFMGLNGTYSYALGNNLLFVLELGAINLVVVTALFKRGWRGKYDINLKDKEGDER